jgi:hypothetical protein
LRCGPMRFEALYVDVQYLDARSLPDLLRLGRAGLPIFLQQRPQQAGKVKNPGFEAKLDSLQALPHVRQELAQSLSSPPLLQGDSLPDYWVREAGDTLFCFFAHPFTRDLAYPMTSGDSYTQDTLRFDLKLNYQGKSHALPLRFAPYQSLLLQVLPDGSLQWIDIEFRPSDPVVKPPSKERMYF